MLIAQLSDPHIRPRGVLHHGVVDTNAMFGAAIDHLLALSPRPDLVILSGDVADEGLPAEYQLARQMLARIPMPLMVIPGNHDSRELFRQAFADQAHRPETGPLHLVSGDHGPVRVIGLDVTVPGEHHGLVDEAAAAWLLRALAEEPDRPTIVTMHQPPFETGIAYVDDYWCREGERLAAVTSRFPAIERIACGHVHRFMMMRFGGTMLCTAPSTQASIALRWEEGAEPASFVEPPAYLLHRFTPHTGLVTHLVPIGTFAGPYPFA